MKMPRMMAMKFTPENYDLVVALMPHGFMASPAASGRIRKPFKAKALRNPGQVRYSPRTVKTESVYIVINCPGVRWVGGNVDGGAEPAISVENFWIGKTEFKNRFRFVDGPRKNEFAEVVEIG